MSTTTEPVFIAFTIWRDTSLGAAAPGTSTAPMTRSAESTCCSTAARLLEAARADLDRHPARDFRHRREQRQSAARFRHRLVGDANGPGGGEIPDLRRVRREVQVGEQDMLLVQLPALLGLRFLDFDDQLRLGANVFDNSCPCLLIGRVGGADARSGAGLDDDLMAVRGHLVHRGRRQAAPVLVGLQLLRHPDDHARFIFERASAMLVCSPISILAIWLRCTSSGPSAKRKVLACAYA